MIWAGSPFAQLIEFGTGLPVGAISCQLLGNDGETLLAEWNLTPAEGDISTLLTVGANLNTVTTPLFETRTLTWNYQTSTALVSDRIVYRINRPIPFAATYQGVRSKLGVAAHELPEDDVDLVAAYAELKDLTPGVDLVARLGDRTTLLATAAIEALAALAALPSLQLRAARSESSGSDQFSRYEKIDWEWLRSELGLHVDRVRAALDPTFDATGINAVTFTTAARTPDAVTGQ